jgi:hypothetical protein
MSPEEIEEQQAESVPENYIKPQLITLCTQHGELLKTHGKTIDSTFTAVTSIDKKIDGIILGDIHNPGLISRIVILENFRAIHIRIYWIVGTAILTALTTYVLVLSKVIHR